MSRRPRRGHRTEYALVRLAQGLERLLGPGPSARLGAALGRLAYRPLGIRREVVDGQLLRAFPDRDEAWRRRVALASYAHLGREAMMLLRLARLGPEDVLQVTRVEGLEQLRAAVEAGTGAVLVTGHFGNWEIGGAAVAARGVPLDVVAQRQANPLVDRLLVDARQRLGMTVVRKGGASRAALASLARGRVVALVADQDAHHRGLFVPFFGRPASTHRGPAVLALRSGAPLFMGTAVRQEREGYHVTIQRIGVPDIDNPDARVEALTAATAAALERAVRAAPGQYLWQHRRWKTRPGTVPGGGRYDGRGNDSPSERVLK